MQSIREWIANGEPELDVRQGDINRFHPHHHVRKYLRARGKQNYREVYDIIHPLQQMEQPRPLRRSPFYSRLEGLPDDYKKDFDVGVEVVPFVEEDE